MGRSYKHDDLPNFNVNRDNVQIKEFLHVDCLRQLYLTLVLSSLDILYSNMGSSLQNLYWQYICDLKEADACGDVQESLWSY